MRKERAYTSARSTGFSVIWICISTIRDPTPGAPGMSVLCTPTFMRGIYTLKVESTVSRRNLVCFIGSSIILPHIY